MILNHRQGCLPLTTALNLRQNVVPSVGVSSLAFLARGDGRSVGLATGDDAFSCDDARDYCPLSGQRALTRQVMQCLLLLPSISNPLLWFSDPDHGVSRFRRDLASGAQSSWVWSCSSPGWRSSMSFTAHPLARPVQTWALTSVAKSWERRSQVNPSCRDFRAKTPPGANSRLRSLVWKARSMGAGDTRTSAEGQTGCFPLTSALTRVPEHSAILQDSRKNPAPRQASTQSLSPSPSLPRPFPPTTETACPAGLTPEQASHPEGEATVEATSRLGQLNSFGDRGCIQEASPVTASPWS